MYEVMGSIPGEVGRRGGVVERRGKKCGGEKKRRRKKKPQKLVAILQVIQCIDKWVETQGAPDSPLKLVHP